MKPRRCTNPAHTLGRTGRGECIACRREADRRYKSRRREQRNIVELALYRPWGLS